MNILVTGGAGFIGSHFVDFVCKKGFNVTVLDALTYASDLKFVNPKASFIKGSICDYELIKSIIPNLDIIVNFAAETHVDNSITDARAFINTNILGVYTLLECIKNTPILLVQVSTDEVYGSLAKEDPKFNQLTPYNPSSPYSASKASGDHLALAWHKTYGANVIVTNCSNNFGPRQNKEKLIPKVIFNALHNNPIPIYGNGKNIRDWIYVEDHVMGIWLCIQNGQIGNQYLLGGDNELSNLEIVKLICDEMDKIIPREKSYNNLISFVEDRKGHDFRYSIDNFYVNHEIGFEPSKTFDVHIKKTIDWYLKHFYL